MRSCPWRFSVFLLGSRQLLLILSQRAGYRLCPVHTVLCLWTGSFTASLFKSFQAHDQHYLLKTVSDGWALRTKKTQRERERERNGTWQAFGKSLPEINSSVCHGQGWQYNHRSAKPTAEVKNKQMKKWRKRWKEKKWTRFKAALHFHLPTS